MTFSPITEEDETFFILKFGTDIQDIFDKWIFNEVSFTRKERYVLAKLMDDNYDNLISYKATMDEISKNGIQLDNED